MIRLVLIPGTDGVKTIIPMVPFTTGFAGIMYHKSSGITYAARKSKSPFLLTHTRRPRYKLGCTAHFTTLEKWQSIFLQHDMHVVQTIPLGEDIDNIGPEYHIRTGEPAHALCAGYIDRYSLG
jgi:hypothetical protein